MADPTPTTFGGPAVGQLAPDDMAYLAADGYGWPAADLGAFEPRPRGIDAEEADLLRKLDRLKAAKARRDRDARIAALAQEVAALEDELGVYADDLPDA